MQTPKRKKIATFFEEKIANLKKNGKISKYYFITYIISMFILYKFLDIINIINNQLVTW